MRLRRQPMRRVADTATARDREAIRRTFAQTIHQCWQRNAYRCEGCDCVVVEIEAAHLCGKGGTGLQLEERWASHPALGAALCIDSPVDGRLGCHQTLDRRRPGWQSLRYSLLTTALRRLPADCPDDVRRVVSAARDASVLKDGAA